MVTDTHSVHHQVRIDEDTRSRTEETAATVVGPMVRVGVGSRYWRPVFELA